MNTSKTYFKGLAVALGLFALLLLFFWLPALTELSSSQESDNNYFGFFLVILLAIVSLCIYVSAMVILKYSEKTVGALINVTTFLIVIGLFSFLQKESGAIIMDVDTLLWLAAIVLVGFFTYKLHRRLLGK